MAQLILISGGSRSGKSAFAQQMAEDIPGDRLFIATCPRTDPEMEERIRLHIQARQGRDWQSVEEPLHPEQIFASCAPDTTLLLDCLTLWVNNVMYDCEKSEKKVDDGCIAVLAEKLAQAGLDYPGTVIMVTGEVGLGIVPDNPLTRRYRDLVGQCNQIVASYADEVYLVSCGIPIQIK